LLHKNAAAVGQHESADVDRVSCGVFGRDSAYRSRWSNRPSWRSTWKAVTGHSGGPSASC
jgi:hypothetical protein